MKGSKHHSHEYQELKRHIRADILASLKCYSHCESHKEQGFWSYQGNVVKGYVSNSIWIPDTFVPSINNKSKCLDK